MLRRYVEQIWRIPTDHFDPQRARSAKLMRHRPVPLELVLVPGSTYNRTKLKERLYDTGLKVRRCEICGQGEEWNGSQMSLILDHVNGVADDNRLENLRIVCPNCAATLDTHCGRKNRRTSRACEWCGETFMPRADKQRYCSSYCGTRHSIRRRRPKPARRKVERPAYEQLRAELESMSFVAVGRKYGVSDNAVRKWIRGYEYEREMEGWRKDRSQVRQDAE